MEEELKCPICFCLAESPYESNCCGNIFCEICVGLLKKNDEYYKCPICRKNVTFRESSFAKRLLTNLVVKCVYKCGQSLLFHKMKSHMKTCIEREFSCKLDDLCKFKAKKDEFLQHIIISHSAIILNVSENFTKVKELLPDIEITSPLVKKQELKDNVNNILSELNYFNRDTLNDPYDYNYNNATNMDRSFYRNYLFRRRLLTSESSKNQSDIGNEDISVQSVDSISNNQRHSHSKSITRKNENTISNQISTNLFKYYYNDHCKDSEQINYVDPGYNKFDPNTADEEDYKNLYKQLVSQNRILKTEILDKIKKNNDTTPVTFHNTENLSDEVLKIEEEAKEIDSIYKQSHKINNMIVNENGLKEIYDSEKTKMIPCDKTSSINTTLSLCLNNEIK